MTTSYPLKKYLSIHGYVKYSDVDEKIDKIKKAIFKKLNKAEKEISDFDVIKFIHEKKMRTLKDLSELQSECYGMALLLNEIDLPHIEHLIEANKYELLRYKKDGLEKVEILADVGCEHCRKNHGLVLSIDKALEKMLIPNKNCSHIIYKGAEPFCRCSYIPCIIVN